MVLPHLEVVGLSTCREMNILSPELPSGLPPGTPGDSPEENINQGRPFPTMTEKMYWQTWSDPDCPANKVLVC